MLSLRYFACEACGTVYASPDTPPGCDECGGPPPSEITHELGSDTYFTRRAHRR